MRNRPKVKINPRKIMGVEDFIRPPKKSSDKHPKSNSGKTTLDRINKSVR